MNRISTLNAFESKYCESIFIFLSTFIWTPFSDFGFTNEMPFFLVSRIIIIRPGECLVLKYGEEKRDDWISDIWINFSIFYWVSLSHESIGSTRESRVQRENRMHFHTIDICESQCEFNGGHWIESHSQCRHCIRAPCIWDDPQLFCTLFTHRCSDFYWKYFEFEFQTHNWIFHEVNILLLVEFVIAKSLNSVPSGPEEFFLSI